MAKCSGIFIKVDKNEIDIKTAVVIPDLNIIGQSSQIRHNRPIVIIPDPA